MTRKANRGDTVSVHYKGTLDNGMVFDSSRQRSPVKFTIGEGTLIQDFEHAVIDMTEGDKKTFTVDADRAYGPRREELVLTLPRDQVPGDIELDLGIKLRLQAKDDKQVIVEVTEIKDESVTLDANPPLAGENLTFEIELMEIHSPLVQA